MSQSVSWLVVRSGILSLEARNSLLCSYWSKSLLIAKPSFIKIKTTVQGINISIDEIAYVHHFKGLRFAKKNGANRKGMSQTSRVYLVLPPIAYTF